MNNRYRQIKRIRVLRLRKLLNNHKNNMQLAEVMIYNSIKKNMQYFNNIEVKLNDTNSIS